MANCQQCGAAFTQGLAAALARSKPAKAHAYMPKRVCEKGRSVR
jgi:hypothetical protein